MQCNAMCTQWIFKLIFYSRQLFIYQCIFLSLHYPNILLINSIERSNHIQLILCSLIDVFQIFQVLNWRIRIVLDHSLIYSDWNNWLISNSSGNISSWRNIMMEWKTCNCKVFHLFATFSPHLVFSSLIINN